MANTNSGIKFDTSEWDSALAQLQGPFRTSLARSMAVAGGQVLRDEAKQQVPIFTGATALPYGKNDTNPPTPGLLRDAIYVAFKEDRSNDMQVTYSVSWNGKVAPHGHLIEFGHWRYNKITAGGVPQKSKVGKGRNAEHTLPGALDTPQWVAAQPFLRPAYDVGVGKAKQAMIDRGRQRLPELLAEMNQGKANGT